jgi:hypothetical protein
MSLALRLARRFHTREVLTVLIGVMAFFFVLDLGDARGFSSLRFFDLNDSNVAHRITLSSLVIGALLLCAAVLAFASSTTPTWKPRARFWFRTSGFLFALFGIDEILGIHTWANQQGVSWAISYLPFVAVATLAWFEMARSFESRRTEHLCMIGLGAFILASAFDAARAGEPHSYALGELLEMAAASLFVAAFVRRAHQYRRPDIEEEGHDGDLAAVACLVQRLNPVRLGFWAAVVVVSLGTMGAISHGAHYMRVFDVNKEQNYASMFSGLALWAAAVMAICNGVFREERRRRRRWWVALALVFVYLGLDEMAALHEELQHLTGIWGQAFLLPVVVVGVAAWYVTLAQMLANRLAVVLWVGGAAFWVVSQGIDLLLNAPMPWTTIPEELGEMTGSLLFGFSLLLVLRPLAAEVATMVAPV